jgi:RimJ/RimL family protein N-acetyltransferase
VAGKAMIEGRLCRLRELREDDLQLLADLRNDLVTQAWSRTLPTDYTLEMMRRRYWDRDFSYHPELGMFIIEDRESGQAAGFANYSVEGDRHLATVGVVVAQPWFGTGVPIEAVDLVLWMLFHLMGFEAARLWTHSGNPRAVRAAEKLGFREAVRLREAIYKDGRRNDNLLMDQLREEWLGRHPNPPDVLEPGVGLSRES